jgi:ABC-type Zn uptake system ZnuABC Zn-binding protein ZnuA
MRKMLGLFCLLLLSWGAAAQAGPMQVAVGVAPVEQFARKFGGTLIQTIVLVPAGADAL